MTVAGRLQPIVDRIIGTALPFGVRFWDGSALGPSAAHSVSMP